MIRRFLILFCFVSVLSGCATCANGPLYTKAPATLDKKGTLYIFRTKATLGTTPIVKINDKPFVKLTAAGYSYVYLKPGIYRLSFLYKFGGGFISEIEIKEGQEFYAEYYTSGMGENFKEIPADAAFCEIDSCRYIVPINSDF